MCVCVFGALNYLSFPLNCKWCGDAKIMTIWGGLKSCAGAHGAMPPKSAAVPHDTMPPKVICSALDKQDYDLYFLSCIPAANCNIYPSVLGLLETR